MKLEHMQNIAASNRARLAVQLAALSRENRALAALKQHYENQKTLDRLAPIVPGEFVSQWNGRCYRRVPA